MRSMLNENIHIGNLMETYQITAIRNAFKRKDGLREGLKEGDLLLSLSLGILSLETGIRLDYLKQNIDLIKDL